MVLNSQKIWNYYYNLKNTVFLFVEQNNNNNKNLFQLLKHFISCYLKIRRFNLILPVTFEEIRKIAKN